MAEANDENAPKFPSPGIPTIFGDSIWNLATNAQVAKFYIARADPSTSHDNVNQSEIAAQIVLPVAALVNGLGFLLGSLRHQLSRDPAMRAAIRTVADPDAIKLLGLQVDDAPGA